MGKKVGTTWCGDGNIEMSNSFFFSSFLSSSTVVWWLVRETLREKARLFSASCRDDSGARHAQCSPAIVLEDVDLPYHVQHEQEGAHDRQTDADPRQQDAIALGHNVHLVAGTL